MVNYSFFVPEIACNPSHNGIVAVSSDKNVPIVGTVPDSASVFFGRVAYPCNTSKDDSVSAIPYVPDGRHVDVILKNAVPIEGFTAPQNSG